MEIGMNFETLLVTTSHSFAYITLNRPAVKNAMNNQMVLDIIAAFEGLKDNREVRAIILSGAEGTFCAGGDLKDMQALQSGATDNFSGTLDKMLRTINEAPQVVIAKVEGAAMGGGFGIVCVSDIAIASTEAKMGLPEVRLGIVPALISPYVIARVGLTRARELMLTGRRFDGLTACDYGIVHETVVPEELEQRLNVILDEIKLCSPHALAACKQLIFAVKDKSTASTVDYRSNLLSQLRQSEDGQEGMKAFLEKRPANWTK
ncbi:MAG: enoyl-CoA hydratase/isomerase family protein [Anaerolineaceae bacterium]|nr:enoyl-CoA hydratase/isomerase family protein [Anaerolineaceae bacterium]